MGKDGLPNFVHKRNIIQTPSQQQLISHLLSFKSHGHGAISTNATFCIVLGVVKLMAAVKKIKYMYDKLLNVIVGFE